MGSHPGVVVRLWHHILQEMGLAGTLGWRPVSWRENWSATHKVQPPGHPLHWTVEVQTEGYIVLDPRVRGVPSISPTHTHSPTALPASILCLVVGADWGPPLPVWTH